jgi:hypothetical protein
VLRWLMRLRIIRKGDVEGKDREQKFYDRYEKCSVNILGHGSPTN